MEISFRADRFATLYFFHPLQHLQSNFNGTKIPILMYHGISDVDDSARHPYFRTATAPKVFQSHLMFLHAEGYRTISLGEATRLLRKPTFAAGKAVVITFDDGLQDFYTNAFPLLSDYGYTATVFLPTAYIGNNARKFNGIECLTWGQARELQRTGIEFGSHTVTHPRLKTLKMHDIREEIRSSKEHIQQELSCPVTSFSYPYAFPETDAPFTAALQALLEESGYRNGVSTVIGTADKTTNVFFFKRLPINGCDDRRLFEAKIAGAYDWLHLLQYVSKLAKS